MRRFRRVAALLTLAVTAQMFSAVPALAQAGGDTDGPVITFISPAERENTPSSSVTVELSVRDSSELERVFVFLEARSGGALLRTFDGTDWVDRDVDRTRLDLVPIGSGVYTRTFDDVLDMDSPRLSYHLVAIARDSAGNLTRRTRQFFGPVDPNRVERAIQIVSPARLASTDSASVTLEFDVSDEYQVDTLRFFVKNQTDNSYLNGDRFQPRWATVEAEPIGNNRFAASFDNVLSPDKTYVVRTRRVQAADGTLLYADDLIFFGPQDSTPPPTPAEFDAPKVSISSPAMGDIAATPTFSAGFELMDSSEITSVRYTLQRTSDGAFYQGGNGFANNFALVAADKLDDGLYGANVENLLGYGEEYSLRVVARDEWGNRTDGAERPTTSFFGPTDSQAPTVTVLSVSENGSGGLNIELRSLDPEGSALRRRFWVMDRTTGNFLANTAHGWEFRPGFRTIAAREIEVPAGQYRIRAIATDEAGNRGVSAATDFDYEPGSEPLEPDFVITARSDTRQWIEVYVPSEEVGLRKYRQTKFWIRDVDTGEYLQSRKDFGPGLNEFRLKFNNPTYRYRYNVTLPAGSYEIGLIGVDQFGETVESAPVAFSWPEGLDTR